jgi:hypothetical protein
LPVCALPPREQGGLHQSAGQASACREGRDQSAHKPTRQTTDHNTCSCRRRHRAGTAGACRETHGSSEPSLKPPCSLPTFPACASPPREQGGLHQSAGQASACREGHEQSAHKPTRQTTDRNTCSCRRRHRAGTAGAYRARVAGVTRRRWTWVGVEGFLLMRAGYEGGRAGGGERQRIGRERKRWIGASEGAGLQARGGRRRLRGVARGGGV